jgi:hypothetical protein
MRHSYLDVEECLVVIFADKWGLRQKIVVLKANIEDSFETTCPITA